MWRGIEYGTAPTVFPMIGYNTHGFSAFAMGGYAIDGSHQEVDLGVSYTASELLLVFLITIILRLLVKKTSTSS